MESFTIDLPAGYLANGFRYQDADLRPLTGADEAFLMDAGEALLPAHRATALLARCLTRLGPYDRIDEEIVRSLTIGDREFLLLNLRLLTWGDAMECVLDCPYPDCKEKIDLDLKVKDLLVPSYPNIKETYEMAFQDNSGYYRVLFRLPTGADQEAAAVLAHKDLRAATDLLLNRCILGITKESGGQEQKESSSLDLAKRLSAVMAELDSQALMTLNFRCPVCDREISSSFDIVSFFFKEIDNRKKILYREVHTLAFHYHWSETEIMNMTPKKRNLYLQLLEEELTIGERM